MPEPFSPDPASNPETVAKVEKGGGFLRAAVVFLGAGIFFAAAIGLAIYAFHSYRAGRGAADPAEVQEKRGEAEPSTGSAETQPEPGNEKDNDHDKSKGTAVEADAPAELKLISAAPFTDVIGNVYVICIVKYNGITKASSVRADVTLLNAAGGEAGKGFGYSILTIVEPLQTIPIKVLVKKPGQFASITTRLTYRPVRYKVDNIPITVSETKLIQKPSLYVEGRLTNVGTRPASRAHAVVIVYDGAGIACGTGSGYAPNRDLAPGDTESFKAYVHPQDCRAARFEVLTEARAAR